MEEFHITGTTIVQPVLDSDIIDERFVFPCRITGRNRTSDHNTETIVPESLGKLEVVIRASSAFDIIGRFHAETDIHGLTYYIRNLVLQEGIQRIVHIESSGRVSFRHIHTCYKHRYRQFTPLFRTHGIELFLYGRIFRRFERKCQTEIFQPIRQGDTHIKTYHAGGLAFATYIRTDAFGGLDIHGRIHHIACPIQITAILNVESLEWNDWYFVLQFATYYRITAIEKHFALRCVLECQVASTFHFHIVGTIHRQVYMRLHGLVDVNRHGNVHTGQCSGLSTAIIHRNRIVEVHELYHITQTVVHHQRRILQHVREIGLTEYIHVTTHL